MNRDDWQQVMENEAVSVKDDAWAEETRQAARRHWWTDLPLPLLCFAVLAGVQVLLFAAQLPAQLCLGVMLAVGLLSSVLGERGQHPWAVAAATLVYLPVAWLTVVLWQWLLPMHAPLMPGIDDLGSVVLAVLAANAAHVGQASRRWTRGRPVKL